MKRHPCQVMSWAEYLKDVPLAELSNEVTRRLQQLDMMSKPRCGQDQADCQRKNT